MLVILEVSLQIKSEARVLDSLSRAVSDPRRTDYQDVATLQIKCPELFKFRISAGKRMSHIDDPERMPPHRNLSISLTSDRVRSNRTFWNRTSRTKSHGRRSI
ncbi:MAG: hypothetical protein QOI53_2945, partial [Verrucomicrobiota bacterium]|nr:hypothetical protein [Verrucomicrobiota bacterium]